MIAALAIAAALATGNTVLAKPAEQTTTTPAPKQEQAPPRPSLARLRHNPEAIRHAFESGEFPYKTRMGNKVYEEEMAKLQVELLKLQNWVKETGERIIVLFEGRDAAGKQVPEGGQARGAGPDHAPGSGFSS